MTDTTQLAAGGTAAAGVVAVALGFVPPQYALYATAACGVCALASAIIPPPSNPALARLWAVVQAMGANFLHARNAK